MSSIFYRDSGSGSPLIFLHGFCETHETWSQFTAQLSSKRRVIAPDLPGFGDSPPLTGDFSMSDVADAIKDWILQLNVPKPILIGHSLGGYVTLALAEKHPDLVAGFGLFHSTALPDSAEKKENRVKVIEFVEKNGVQKYVESFIPGLFHQKDNAYIPKAIAIARKTPLQTFVSYTNAMMSRPSREHVLRDTKVPVLLIAGDRDSGIPIATIEAQAALNKRIILQVLPDTGHMGMFESEKASADAISAFATALSQ